jgi:hypothetical protein
MAKLVADARATMAALGVVEVVAEGLAGVL